MLLFRMNESIRDYKYSYKDISKKLNLNGLFDFSIDFMLLDVKKCLFNLQILWIYH